MPVDAGIKASAAILCAASALLVIHGLFRMARRWRFERYAAGQIIAGFGFIILFSPPLLAPHAVDEVANLTGVVGTIAILAGLAVAWVGKRELQRERDRELL